MVSLALMICAFLFGGYFWLGLAPLCLTFTRCLASALKLASIRASGELRATLLVTLLVFLGPLVGLLSVIAGVCAVFERSKRSSPMEPCSPRTSPGSNALFISPTGTRTDRKKKASLHGVMESLLPRKYLIAVDQGWSHWDLEICQGPWAKAQVMVASENHGGTKRLLRVRCALRLSRVSIACFCAYVFMAAITAILGFTPITATAVVIRFGSRWCDPVPKIPHRPCALPRRGIRGAQAAVRAGSKSTSEACLKALN